jgi:hypothetical protein
MSQVYCNEHKTVLSVSWDLSICVHDEQVFFFSFFFFLSVGISLGRFTSLHLSSRRAGPGTWAVAPQDGRGSFERHHRLGFLPPHLRASSRIFSHLLVSSRIFSHLLVSSRIFPHRLAASRIFSHRLASARIFSHLLASCRIFSHLVVSCRIFSHLLVSSRLICLLSSLVL